jgi:hypothetical protein
MGCNCKTTENIIKFHDKYGEKVNVSWGKMVGFKTGEFIKIMLVLLLSVIILPITFTWIIIRVFRGKTTIDINQIIKKLLRK